MVLYLLLGVKMKFLISLPLLLLSSIAYAEQAQGAPGVMSNVLLLGAFIFLFYFMLIRPQSKKQKEHQNLISSVSKDDEIITSGGILGKVVKVTDQFLVISISDNINVTVQKQSVAAALPKGTMKDI
jgi:preprotein translocase subunit YajC